MKKIVQYIIHPFYKRYHFWYHRKPRNYKYKNVYTMVQPGVFSPKHTVSTKVFLDFISTLNLVSKNVLELGCGSGIIAIHTAFMGAKVVASDINQTALTSLALVAKNQNLLVKTVESNLFDKLTNLPFDYIFINPPYYPQQPQTIAEQAWFCGPNFEYFKKLFSQLAGPLKSGAKPYMILSNQCEVGQIQLFAKEQGILFTLVHEETLTFEVNYIFLLHLE